MRFTFFGGWWHQYPVARAAQTAACIPIIERIGRTLFFFQCLRTTRRSGSYTRYPQVHVGTTPLRLGSGRPRRPGRPAWQISISPPSAMASPLGEASRRPLPPFQERSASRFSTPSGSTEVLPMFIANRPGRLSVPAPAARLSTATKQDRGRTHQA